MSLRNGTPSTTPCRSAGGSARKGYLSAISVGLASRRLSLSQYDLTSDCHKTDREGNNQQESSSNSIDTNEDDGGELALLKQEKEDLVHQFQRKVDELREKITQLDVAEDLNHSLKLDIELKKKEHRCVVQRLETTIAKLNLDMDQLKEVVEETKQELHTKKIEVTRLEKCIHDLKMDLDESQAELNKGVKEVIWLHSEINTMKAKLKDTEKGFQLFAEEESSKSLKLESDNQRICAELEELRKSNKILEQEKNEMEVALAQNRHFSQTESEGHQAPIVFDDSADLQDMDTEELMKIAFPPIKDGMSLYSEIQSTLESLPVLFQETSTQTEEQPVNLSEPSLPDQSNPVNAQSVDTPVSNEGNLTTVEGASPNTATSEESAWNMIQPIDNRRGAVSMGAIPDEDRERMVQYAYDVPLRSCNQEAAILSRQEWRTLRSDLDQVDLEKFKKHYGQEEDTDDISPYRASRRTDDLDEFAETYSEQFPFLAESIFEELKFITPMTATLADLPVLKARFEELASMFRTDHDQLDRRGQFAKDMHDNASSRLSNLSLTLQESLQVIRTQKMPGEVRELVNSVSDRISTLDSLTRTLDGSAKNLGRFDVQKRVLKLIEVMVLYVRVLKTTCGNIDQEQKLAKQLLSENGIALPDASVSRSASHRTTCRNNNKGIRLIKCLNGNMCQRISKLGQWISGEFTWPWDEGTTWRGIRKGFAIILMLFGLLLITQLTTVPSCTTSLNVKALMDIARSYPIRM